SDGLRQVAEEVRFSLIASNLPAKVGNEWLTLFLEEARQRLEPGGRLYVVTVAGLRDYLRRSFRELFGNYTKIKQGRSHVVSMATRE
ncbi:methyltransferase, partial [Candidatus Latescibacterota bacterium]